MKKERIGRITYNNFGSNNYSCGLEAVTFDPQEITWKEVLTLDGFFLHPNLKPNDCEIYALKGTAKQYKEFCIAVAEQEAMKFAEEETGLSVFGHLTDEEWKTLEKAQRKFTFVPWFLK